MIFEKALDEPKYSSMYAQLCRRISKESSMLEPEGDSRYTFELLLIRVCQDKFVHRSQYTEKIINAPSQEDIDEEERRYIAKQKILGNVKFIGELFKLEILNAATLYKMLEQLLDKKSRPNPSLEDRCEDMECLSQIFKTCGRNLDTDKSKNLIDQYFNNMERKSNSSKYPPRIRFMLRDIIELRKDGWKPRKVARIEGPVPIQDLNTDEEYIRQQRDLRSRTMEYQNRNSDRNWMDKLPLSLQSMNNYSGTLSMTSSSSMISGPINPPMGNSYNSSGAGGRDNNGRDSLTNYGGGYRNNNNNNNNNNGNHHSQHQRNHDNGRMMNKYNNHSSSSNNNNNLNMDGGAKGKYNMKPQHNNNMSMNNMGMNRHQQQQERDGGNYGHHNSHQNNHQNSYNNMNSMNNNMSNSSSSSNSMNNSNNMNMLSNKELAPRFKRSLVTPTSSTSSVDDLQMRPPTNSLLFKASNINKQNPQQLPINQQPNRSGNSSPGFSSNISSSATSNVDNLIPSFNSSILISNGKQSNATQEITKPSSPQMQSPSPQNNQQKDHQIAVTKQGSIEKPKAKKDKGPTRDEVLKKVSQFLNDTLFSKEVMDDIEKSRIITTTAVVEEITDTHNNNNNNGHANGKADEIIEECVENVEKKDEENVVAAVAEENLKNETKNDEEVKEKEEETEEKLNDEDVPSIKSLDDIVKLYYDLKVPEKFLKDSIVKVLNESLDKSDQAHETAIEFLMAMQKDKRLTANQITDALRTVINGMNEREKTIPKITTLVASLLARSMTKKICKLNDIANFTSNGQHYPLMLLVLQQLHKTIGDDSLVEVFNASKVNLMSSLPECDRTKERLAEILDDRKLSFLQPLLRIESELWRQIKEDPQPQTFYKWIKDNVDAARYTDPGFITALMTVVLRFITQVKF